jgi:alpha-1,6-mannosyltransferase
MSTDSVTSATPVGVPVRPTGLILRPALLGFVAITAICTGSSLPSSPFKLELPGAWFFGVPKTSGASSWGLLFVLASVYGGLLLLMRTWWGMTRLYARFPGVSVRQLSWVLALWSLPLLLVGPIFSHDVYSYAAQGEMVSHHVNPYLYGPLELGNNSYTAHVDSIWSNAPAPYGPLFLQIDGLFTQLTFHNELATIVLLRLLAVGGVVLIAVCVPRLARLYRRDGGELFTLMVLNPVTILYLIGGAHNDALMLGLLVAGLTAAKEKRPVVGVLLCALAAAIKAPAALGVLYVGWSWLGPESPLRYRIRPVATAVLMATGVLGFFSFITGLGWGWVTILGTPGAVRSWTAPTTALAFLAADLAHFFGIGLGVDGVLTVTRVIGLLVALAVGGWLLSNSDRIGTMKALGLSLLTLVILGPIDQPWYLLWGLVLLAPVAFGRLRTLVVGLSIVTAFIELPSATQILPSLLHGTLFSLALALGWLLFLLSVPLTGGDGVHLRRWREGRAVPGPLTLSPEVVR